MKYIKLFLCLVAYAYFFAGCNKEKLGEFYFECKVNGREFKPNNCANCNDFKILKDTLLLTNANLSGETIKFGIIDFPIQTKSYDLNNITRNTANYDNTIGNPSDIFKTDSLRTGKLIIDFLDKTNNIIEGTFSFSAYNSVSNTTVIITDGKFRTRYSIN